MIPLTYNGIIILILTLFISTAAWAGVIRSVIEDHNIRQAVFEAMAEDFMTGGEEPL